MEIIEKNIKKIPRGKIFLAESIYKKYPIKVVAAFWFEGKRYLRPRVIKKLRNRLGEKYFSEVLLHIDKMPAWMRKVFLRYQRMQPDDSEFAEDPDESWCG